MRRDAPPIPTHISPTVTRHNASDRISMSKPIVIHGASRRICGTSVKWKLMSFSSDRSVLSDVDMNIYSTVSIRATELLRSRHEANITDLCAAMWTADENNLYHGTSPHRLGKRRSSKRGNRIVCIAGKWLGFKAKRGVRLLAR